MSDLLKAQGQTLVCLSELAEMEAAFDQATTELAACRAERERLEALVDLACAAEETGAQWRRFNLTLAVRAELERRRAL